MKICNLFVVMGNTSELSFLENSNVVNTVAENFSANADFFLRQGKKLKVFQKLDTNIVYFADLSFGLQQLVCIHTYQEQARMKEALFQTEALEYYRRISICCQNTFSLCFSDQLLKKGYTISLINHVRNL